MKINIVTTSISGLIAILFYYGFYSFASTASNSTILAIGSMINIFLSLFGIMGFSIVNYNRATTNIRAVSSLFLIINLVINVIFAIIKFSLPVFIITNGISILIWILVVYGISHNKL